MIKFVLSYDSLHIFYGQFDDKGAELSSYEYWCSADYY